MLGGGLDGVPDDGGGAADGKVDVHVAGLGGSGKIPDQDGVGHRLRVKIQCVEVVTQLQGAVAVAVETEDLDLPRMGNAQDDLLHQFLADVFGDLPDGGLIVGGQHLDPVDAGLLGGLPGVDKEGKIVPELRKAGVAQLLGEPQHRGPGGTAQLRQLIEVGAQGLDMVIDNVVRDLLFLVGQLGGMLLQPL